MPHNASRVSRSRLEACQRQGARAGVDIVAFRRRGVPMPFGSSSCAAAYSGERLRSDENEASVVNARTSVVSIACDLLNKLAIRLEDLSSVPPKLTRSARSRSASWLTLQGVARAGGIRGRSFVLPRPVSHRYLV
jgi:hypothetical protein